MKAQSLISVVSTDLLRVVFFCLSRALPIYRTNAQRSGIARPENVECASAVLLLTTMLDSHLTRLMWFHPKGLTTAAALMKKVASYLATPVHEPLRRQLDEVVAVRDAVTHAHLWESTPQQDDTEEIVSNEWRITGLTATTSRLERTVDLGARAITTRELGLNVIPTNVGVCDVAKALVVVCRAMRELEHEYGNPAAWVGPVPSAEEIVAVFLDTHGDDNLEGWIAGLLRKLHEPHLSEIIDLFGLGTVQLNGRLEFTAISRVH